VGDGVLALREVQPEGRGAMDAGAWWRGARLAPGDRLG
jgi:methionyl-tRNA formyltransferase